MRLLRILRNRSFESLCSCAASLFSPVRRDKETSSRIQSSLPELRRQDNLYCSLEIRVPLVVLVSNTEWMLAGELTCIQETVLTQSLHSEPSIHFKRARPICSLPMSKTVKYRRRKTLPRIQNGSPLLLRKSMPLIPTKQSPSCLMM